MAIDKNAKKETLRKRCVGSHEQVIEQNRCYHRRYNYRKELTRCVENFRRSESVYQNAVNGAGVSQVDI